MGEFGPGTESWSGTGGGGYPEDASGYRREPNGEFRPPAEDGQWRADRAFSRNDSQSQWSEDGERWSDEGPAPWSETSRAPRSGYEMPSAGFGQSAGRKYHPVTDGRYGPPPDVLQPLPELPTREPSRPELRPPDLPRRELARPQLESAEGLGREPLRSELQRPQSQRPEPQRPESQRPESQRPELEHPGSRLHELPRPELRRPETAWPETARRGGASPEGARLPELPRPGSGSGQFAGAGGDGPRSFDVRPAQGDPGLPDSPELRTGPSPSVVAKSEQPATALGRDAAGGAANSPAKDHDSDDDTVTAPLPVILPGATSLPRPAPVEEPRGFFEPALPPGTTARPVSITGSVEPPPAEYATPVAPRPMPLEAEAKLDQLKDLYLTAEAIGEDALDKHFEQVSQKQRELIKEFFDRSSSGGTGAS